LRMDRVKKRAFARTMIINISKNTALQNSLAIAVVH
jgi:hypothetical protein